MRSLFFQVLEMSATASAVILIVLLLRFCLCRAPKVYSYALWSVVLFRLLCPVSIESGLSILPRQTAATQTEIARHEAIKAGEEYLAAYHAAGDSLNSELDFIDVKLEPEYVQTLEEDAQHGTTALTHNEAWKLLLAGIWPVGAVFLLGRSLISMWKLKRSLRGAVLMRDNIYLSQNIQTPFTMGLFRPAIYLPDGLGEHEQSYIICHERHHIRRADHIIKVLAFFALCIHWFNPLVWLAFHLAGKDMEMSCDEAVVKRMGADIRADYSQSLLTLATGRRMAVGTHLAFGDGDTKGRIKNVLRWKKPKVWVSIAAVLVCAVGICACSVDPVMPKEEQEGLKEVVKQQETQLPKRVWAFEQLKPGQTIYFNEEIVLTDKDSTITCQTTYSRPGLTLEFGLIDEEGREVSRTMEGGSYSGLFGFSVPGRYHPFIRNVDKGYDYANEATGAVAIELSSEKDYFQKSTPRLPENEGSAQLPDDIDMLGQLPGMISIAPEIYEAILDHHRSDKSGQYFCCADYVVLANEVGTRYHPVTGDDLTTMNYYLWVLYQEYLFTEDGIVEMGGAHIPTNITMTANPDGSWSVLNYWEPRDGSYYAEDIKKFFPADCVADALDSQKYIMAQKQNCYQQAVEYAKTDSDVKMDVDSVISGLLDVICSSPMESSNPKDYVADHPIEYREMKYYGDYTRDYCKRHLTALEDAKSRPPGVDLRGRIMEMLLGELSL